MIRLERIPRPSELTEAVEKELTEEYKKSGKAVWRKQFIIDALLEMCHNKCSYCETRLGEEGKHMQVDHYHHKQMYPDEVVSWENLIPSCNRCNSNKSIHNTYVEPIVDPYVDNPSDYLYLENYRYKARNHKGRITLDILYLNDTEGLVLPRFNVGNAIQNKICETMDLVSIYEEDPSVRRMNRIINQTKDLLKESKEDKEYSALVSTVLIQDEVYQRLREKLISLNMWNDEMDLLHNNMCRNALLK